MTFKRKTWKLLLPLCAIYWALVVLFTFGAPVIAGWRVTRPSAGHGAISASLTNATLQIKMSAANTAGWSGTIDLGIFLLWLAVPPLLFWLAWLSRSSRDEVDPRVTNELHRL